MLKLVSTDSVREVMRKYIGEEEEPILHAPAYQCGNFINE